MTRCSFAEFFWACRDRLTDVQLRTLDPCVQYFKVKNGYCGLVLEDERTWVSILVGDMRDIWAMREALLEFPLVGWQCRVGSPMFTIARYYGAEISDSGDKYPDGAPAMRCLIHTLQSKRLQNVDALSQALT